MIHRVFVKVRVKGPATGTIGQLEAREKAHQVLAGVGIDADSKERRKTADDISCAVGCCVGCAGRDGNGGVANHTETLNVCCRFSISSIWEGVIICEAIVTSEADHKLSTRIPVGVGHRGSKRSIEVRD